MRTVMLQMNMRTTADLNFSVRTEILVEDKDAETAGKEAIEFLQRFAAGMSEIETGGDDD
jgi:hypothetical protein